jgi:hypothetical protein
MVTLAAEIMMVPVVVKGVRCGSVHARIVGSGRAV